MTSMTRQGFEQKNDEILSAFEALKKSNPEKLEREIDLSWSNWGFGIEPLATSAERLARNGIKYIELHGNRYGADLGYQTPETRKILEDHGLKVSGVCGMFGSDNDLSSNRPHIRQRAFDYILRQVEMARELGGSYLLVVPGAVGRPTAFDAQEFDRSVETLQRVADVFVDHEIKAAVEPIRAAEVSFCHTVADAKVYIEAVAHQGVQHINGDVYHMWTGEAHIGEAIRSAGERLVNLHLADSNRCALGDGQMDLDTMLRALYLISYNRPGCFCTPEPLGPGGDPYPAMYGKPDPRGLDELVEKSVRTFRAREAVIKQ
jgi:D-psicose/D-tagatose/L-ribulose 3-epimerase